MISAMIFGAGKNEKLNGRRRLPFWPDGTKIALEQRESL
jgi:hypothetical protein